MQRVTTTGRTAAETRQIGERIGRLGREWKSKIVQTLDAEKHQGDILVIDVESGEEGVSLEMSDRLRARRPNAVMWMTRIGADVFWNVASAGRPASV